MIEIIGFVARRMAVQQEMEISKLRSITSLKRRVNAARKNTDPPGEIDALICLGYAYMENHQAEKSLQTYQDALALARQMNSPAQEAIILAGIGRVHQNNLGETAKALSSYRLGLSAAQFSGERDIEAMVLSLLDELSYTAKIEAELEARK
jgi:hypothetical protein